MVRFTCLTLACSVLALFSLVPIASAAERQSASTSVTLNEMCGGCAKKVQAHFSGMEGFGSIQCDIPTKTVVFTPAPGYVLGAQALWSEIDAIGKTPVRLIEPNGTVHTKKP